MDTSSIATHILEQSNYATDTQFLQSSLRGYYQYTVTTSCLERAIYVNITNNTSYMCYEGTFDIAVFQTQFNISTIFKLMNKCFDGTPNYKVRFELEKGTLQLLFDCLVDGFLEIGFVLRLYEKTGLEKEMKLIAEIDELKKRVTELESETDNDSVPQKNENPHFMSRTEQQPVPNTKRTYPCIDSIISEAVIDNVKYTLCNVKFGERTSDKWFRVEFIPPMFNKISLQFQPQPQEQDKTVYLIGDVIKIRQLINNSYTFYNGAQILTQRPPLMYPSYKLENGAFVTNHIPDKTFETRQWCDFTYLNAEKVMNHFKI